MLNIFPIQSIGKPRVDLLPQHNEDLDLSKTDWKPITLPYGDSHDRVIQIWKAYGVFFATIFHDLEKKVLPASAIRNSLNQKEAGEDFLKRIEKMGVKRWDLMLTDYGELNEALMRRTRTIRFLPRGLLGAVLGELGMIVALLVGCLIR